MWSVYTKLTLFDSGTNGTFPIIVIVNEKTNIILRTDNNNSEGNKLLFDRYFMGITYNKLYNVPKYRTYPNRG